MVFGCEAFGRKHGHKGGALMMEFVPLSEREIVRDRETQQDTHTQRSSHHGKIQQEGSCLQESPYREPNQPAC